MATMDDFDFEYNDDNYLYVEDTYIQAVSHLSPSHGHRHGFTENLSRMI
jgi:hypothetical protein